MVLLNTARLTHEGRQDAIHISVVTSCDARIR